MLLSILNLIFQRQGEKYEVDRNKLDHQAAIAKAIMDSKQLLKHSKLTDKVETMSGTENYPYFQKGKSKGDGKSTYLSKNERVHIKILQSASYY